MNVAPAPTVTPPRTVTVAFVPSQVAPAGTVILLYEPDSSVPVHANPSGAAAALEAPTATIVTAAARDPPNATLRIGTSNESAGGGRESIPEPARRTCGGASAFA